jgi:hypothetical protein
MPQNIFISYSSNDIEKVALISSELAGNLDFSPIIIASERESLKPLAAKVADGIRRSEVVVPILTTNSIHTQWINQEIGFAQALDKQIMPIVEKGIIEQLKGFIHKEVHLPYLFGSSPSKAKEHKDFLKQFRLLIADIKPVETNDDVTPLPPPPEKTGFEKSLEVADRLRDQEAFAHRKQEFFRSPEAFPTAKAEFKRLIELATPQLEQIRAKNIEIRFETKDKQQALVVWAGGFTLTFGLDQVGMYVNEQKIILFVRRWKGYLNDQGFYPFEHTPVKILEQQFNFDYDEKLLPRWLEKGTQYTSEQLIDSSLTWLMNEISTARRAAL